MKIFLYKIKEMFVSEQKRWNLWIPVLFAIGIGLYFGLKREPPLWSSLFLFELFLILVYWNRFRAKYLCLLGIVLCVLLGFIHIQLKAVYLSKKEPLQYVVTDYLQGVVQGIDYNYRGMERLILNNPHNFEGKVLSGDYRISLRTNNSGVKIGDCVAMIATMMPLPKTSMVGGYQFDRKFFFEGLKGNGYALSSVDIEPCQNRIAWSLRLSRKIAELRYALVRHVHEVLDADEAGIVAALIAGERSGISKQLIHNYRDAGLAHFLSISGLHMTMLVGLMFFLIRFCVALIPSLALRYDSKKIAAIASLFLSTFYLLISGASVPTIRAYIMTCIVLIGVLIGRQAISMITIAWAAMIILIFMPQALISASFQMSFAAVIMMIAFYEKYAGALYQFLYGKRGEQKGYVSRLIRGIFTYFVGIVIADLVASLATLPLAIYHFNRISLYTSLGNFLAGPIIGLVIMPFLLISFLLMPLGLDEGALKLVGYGVAQVNDITSWVSSLPHAGYQIVSMPFVGLVLIVMGALWLALWQKSWRNWGFIPIFIGCLSIFVVDRPMAMISADGELFAVSDKQGHLVILPKRGDNFHKQMWLEKTANHHLSPSKKKQLNEIWKGKAVHPSWIDLSCQKHVCFYAKDFRYEKKGRLEWNGNFFDTKAHGGASFYPHGKVKTVHDDIGQRLWNKMLEP